jgi:hypothetical protein
MLYLEAIDAIKATPDITCAYRDAWPKRDCIKIISPGSLPWLRNTKPNTNEQNDWDHYQATDEDMDATDWYVLNQCAR